jgi:hypothetical protein
MALAGAGAAQFLISFVRQPGIETILGLDALEWVGVAMMVAGGAMWAGALRGSARTHVPNAGGGEPSSVPRGERFR